MSILTKKDEFPKILKADFELRYLFALAVAYEFTVFFNLELSYFIQMSTAITFDIEYLASQDNDVLMNL